MHVEERAGRELIDRVERRLDGLDAPNTELVAALLDLYGEALERIVAVLAQADDGTLARELAGDELVSHILLVHGLHPVPLEERVLGALAGVEPYLQSHGGSVQLLAIEEGVVSLRLEGSCHGCPSSALTLKAAIEEAILDVAPEVTEVTAEGVREPGSGLLQIECPTGLTGG